MRFSDGVTGENAKGLEAPLARVQAFSPELVVAEEFAAETRFADELPRLDVHGAAIELEREVETGAIREGEREDAIGNDADGERFARGLSVTRAWKGASSSRVSSGR